MWAAHYILMEQHCTEGCRHIRGTRAWSRWESDGRREERMLKANVSSQPSLQGAEGVITTFVSLNSETLGSPDLLKTASSSKPAPVVSQGMVKAILESGIVDRRGKNIAKR